MPTLLLDGQYARGFYVGRSTPRYPFQVNGDVTAIAIMREWRQRAAHFLPGRLGVDLDPKIPGAYLMAEADPVPTNIGDVLAVQRTFARVPGDQVTYGSRVITKPVPSSSISYLLRNYNNVVDLGTAGINNGYAHTSTNKVYGALKVATSATSGGNTRLNIPLHGYSAGSDLVMVLAANEVLLYAPTGQWSVVDANNIDLLGAAFGTGITQVGSYLRAYTPGTDRVGIRLTQKFYLPGITAGITTPADIPIPSVLLNDADFLASVVANTSGYQTYDALELTRWNDWPIYTQTLIEINMADV